MKPLLYSVLAVLLFSVACKKKDSPKEADPPSPPAKQYRLTNIALHHGTLNRVYGFYFEYNADGYIAKYKQVDTGKNSTGTVHDAITKVTKEYFYDANHRIIKEVHTNGVDTPYVLHYTYMADSSGVALTTGEDSLIFIKLSDGRMSHLEQADGNYVMSSTDYEYNDRKNLEKCWTAIGNIANKEQTIWSITHDDKPNPLRTVKGLVNTQSVFYYIISDLLALPDNNITSLTTRWSNYNINYEYNEATKYPSKATYNGKESNYNVSGTLVYTYEEY